MQRVKKTTATKGKCRNSEGVGPNMNLLVHQSSFEGSEQKYKKYLRISS